MRLVIRLRLPDISAPASSHASRQHPTKKRYTLTASLGKYMECLRLALYFLNTIAYILLEICPSPVRPLPLFAGVILPELCLWSIDDRIYMLIRKKYHMNIEQWTHMQANEIYVTSFRNDVAERWTLDLFMSTSDDSLFFLQATQLRLYVFGQCGLRAYNTSVNYRLRWMEMCWQNQI